jgi:phosphoribosylanthranilate isomerase
VTFIKICGITNVDDAIAAVNLGAHLLGFVFAESPRRVDVQTVKHIQRIIGWDAKTVGVFTEESDEVLRIADTTADAVALAQAGDTP